MPPISNPFASEIAAINSSYSSFREGRLTTVVQGNYEKASPAVEYVHDQIRALILEPHFTCVGAKAAINQNVYRFGFYSEMGSVASTAGLAYDLFTFVQERMQMASNFTTYIASFQGPYPGDEIHFETLLWQQLQQLHDVDARFHEWDPTVTSDPSDSNFSFSFSGTSFFVVGLHPASSRFTRKFAWPTLVFNAHEQFEHLRQGGSFAAMQKAIRHRDTDLQGSTNPNLTNYGEQSEARQYSGRKVEPEWKCPFEKHHAPSDTDPQ